MKVKVNIDKDIEEVTQRYAMSVTDTVLETMNPADPADPVALQYMPSRAELVTTAEELQDPIGDNAHSPVKGIVHRYPDRVLLKPVHVCAVYCRFCFRREMVGPGSEMLSDVELATAIDYIRNAPKVWEVIVTGGDPLVMSARRLKNLMDMLNAIPHVEVIRFHTRVPVADVDRVTGDVIAALASDKAVYVVLHANHANELTEKVRATVNRFVAAGIPLLSQSTLLKGVNDDPAVLEALFRKLTAMKVKPYYLHHPDMAPGTSHFRLSIARGREIVSKLWGRMSGIAQPNYVLDIPGGHGKIPAGAAYIAEDGENTVVTDYQGNRHPYPSGK